MKIFENLMYTFLVDQTFLLYLKDWHFQRYVLHSCLVCCVLGNTFMRQIGAKLL